MARRQASPDRGALDVKLPRSKPREVANSRVVVTGGAKGIGLVLTTALCRQGARVVMVGRDTAAGARAVSELTARNLTAEFVAMDLCDEHSICAGSRQIISILGGVDTLVHNAAIPWMGPVEAVQWDEVGQSLDAIIRGPALLTRELLADLRRSERASIVCISSLAASRGFAHASVYSAAKRGLEALAESWYEELRNEGIRVSIVSPSFVNPPRLPEGESAFLAGSELDPWDVADALLYVLKARATACPLRVELRLTQSPWTQAPETDAPGTDIL